MDKLARRIENESVRAMRIAEKEMRDMLRYAKKNEDWCAASTAQAYMNAIQQCVQIVKIVARRNGENA